MPRPRTPRPRKKRHTSCTNTSTITRRLWKVAKYQQDFEEIRGWRWGPDDFRYFSDFRGLPIGKFPEKSRNRPDPNSTPHFGRISMKSMSEGWIRTIYRFLGIFEGSPSANFRKNPGNRPDTTSSPHVENTLKRVADTLKTVLKTCWKYVENVLKNVKKYWNLLRQCFFSQKSSRGASQHVNETCHEAPRIGARHINFLKLF